jgi:ribosome-associated protein
MLKKNNKEKFIIVNKGSITSKRAIHIASDISWNYGEDVVIYDVRNNSPFVSYYIVATASNEHRLKALINIAEEALYDNYKILDHKEGRNGSKWYLLDAKDIVIQLFTKDERERVGFDELYKDVPHKIIKAEVEPVYRRKKRNK